MVAHRLETAVEYCDKIMVLDQGELVQFDAPLNLLVNDPTTDQKVTKDGIFADMVKALTQSQQDKILALCKK